MAAARCARVVLPRGWRRIHVCLFARATARGGGASRGWSAGIAPALLRARCRQWGHGTLPAFLPAGGRAFSSAPRRIVHAHGRPGGSGETLRAADATDAV